MLLPISAHKQSQLDFFLLFKLSTVKKKLKKTSIVENITLISTIERKKLIKILTVEKITSIVKKK